MRVYLVNETTGMITLAAVGNDKLNGNGRYFTYTTARPSPFPSEYPTLPASGATKAGPEEGGRQHVKNFKAPAIIIRNDHLLLTRLNLYRRYHHPPVYSLL